MLRSFLENGRARAKSQCGQLWSASARPGLTVKQDNAAVRPLRGLARRPAGARPRVAMDFRAVPVGRPEVSMESLILAQDERWRRA